MKTIKENKYWIWLSLIPNLGSIKKQKLLNQLKTPEQIYKATKQELTKIEGIGEQTAEQILNPNIKQEIQKHIEYLEQHKIQILTIQDTEYPKQLKEIYDYPITLYIKGNIEAIKQQHIAIIGSREATNYGIKATKYFAYNLAQNGKCIISGLAKGIDSYAHIGAIEAKGKTIAILGNGLHTIYPTENKELANQIIKKGGAIITEYPIGTKPNKMNFPARNRIISGLSESLLVIEAKEKSGTLITTDFALEQGREVYAMPGNINSPNSIGTNDLIKQGAKPATNYHDLLTSTNFY